jgi:hypothetical protein
VLAANVRFGDPVQRRAATPGMDFAHSQSCSGRDAPSRSTHQGAEARVKVRGGSPAAGQALELGSMATADLMDVRHRSAR